MPARKKSAPAAKARAQAPKDAAAPEGAEVASDEAALLARYEAMRDFERTKEPGRAPRPRRTRNDEPLTFVIQKHRATRMHYDIRLEVDGVLKSWPVPRGPSTDPSEKRLAVMTEDHPFDYGTFEGLIPKGEYGAGEVIVWDRGTYSPDEAGPLVFEDRAEAERRMRGDIEAGKVSVTFRGSRMKGSWTFVKTKQASDSWLFFKHRDDAATKVELTQEFDSSVVSGITIAGLQAGQQRPGIEPDPLLAGDLRGAKRAAFVGAVEPMQATQTADPFSNPDWVFEPKLDGIRAIATFEDGVARLTSRRGNEITAQYPSLIASLEKQPANTLILDGEIVAVDERGVPSFERLQQRMNLTNPVEIRQAERDYPVAYYVFDILYVDGVDVRRVPLEHRHRLLERTVMPTPWVRIVEPFDVDGKTAYEAATAIGLEGLVAKRRDSTYDTGRRTPRWLKVKQRLSDEFIVVGYTPGEGSRAKTFGALVIATRDDAGRLVSTGRVGGGFDDVTLKRLLKRLEAMRVDESPLATPPPAADHVTHVRPELVVEVEYSQVTSDGNLRAPVFLRVRDDKLAGAVKRVPLAPAPAASVRSLEDEAADVIEQLERAKQQTTVEVEGAQVRVTNLDKVMWPETKERRAFTKRDLMIYYARMAPYLLNQIRDRPLTMTRYPNGIDGSSFYQKHVESLPGDYVRTVTIHSEGADADQEFVVVNNLATLVWLAQMADLALHTSLARVSPEPDGFHLARDFTGSREQVLQSLLNYPDFILFDLDPYIYRGDEKRGEEPELNKKAFEATCKVALWLKELLDAASLSSFVKTSGATGLHVYVPVLRQYDYDTIRDVAVTLGGFLVSAHPKEITTEWATEKRTGKVFFDANQNARIKNLACAYSPRTKPGAPVSMPLRWDELGKVYPTEFHLLNAHERVARVGDLWAHILDARQDLANLVGAGA